MKMFNANEIIKEVGCINGGSREAAIKLEGALRYAFYDGSNRLHIQKQDIDVAEFTDMVRVLIAFAMSHADEKVQLYYCDGTCSQCHITPCKGEYATSHAATTLCPFYSEEDK